MIAFPARNCLLILVIALATACSAWAANSQDSLPVESTRSAVTPPVRLLLAGNEESLWLGRGIWDRPAKTFIYRFAFQDKAAPAARALYLRPQEGRIVRWAVAGQNLHVFYGKDEHFTTEGTHYRYSVIEGPGESEGVRRELPLPGGAIPAAMCGESSGLSPIVWAVVETATAQSVARDWHEAKASETRPNTDDENGDRLAGAPAAESLIQDAGAYQIVSYDGFIWQPRLSVTPQCPQSERIWICGGDEQFFLFWQSSSNDATVHFATYRKDRWLVGPDLPLKQPIDDGFAIWMNRQLVFAGLWPDETDAQLTRLTLWHWHVGNENGGEWRAGPELQQDGDGKSLQLPAGSQLSGFVDQLAVLRPAQPDPELAFYSAAQGGPPSAPFRAVRVAEAPPASQAERGMRDLLATMVVAAVLLLVFWRRQESIASPVLLPVGLAVAGTGRRLFAALIDMLPACALVAIFWHPPIAGSLQELNEQLQTWWRSVLSNTNQSASETAPWPPGLAWAWLVFRVLYSLYCALFELAWQSTPGKRLMRCEVRLESLERPGKAQTLIRNFTKIIELEPYLRIWPFLLVIFFTRNHQRMGDLLARTIVIERQRVINDAETPDDQSPQE